MQITSETTLTEAERDLVRRVAARDGISEDEAASNLVKAALARRVKRRTGKPMARVYSLPKRRPPP